MVKINQHDLFLIIEFKESSPRHFLIFARYFYSWLIKKSGHLYSGSVAIIYKNELKAEILSESENLNHDHLTAEVSAGQKKIIASVAYIPPRDSRREERYKKLRELNEFMIFTSPSSKPQ